MRGLLVVLPLLLAGPAVAQSNYSLYGPSPSPGCPLIGCTYSGAVHLGANTLDGSAVAFTGGTLTGLTHAGGAMSGTFTGAHTLSGQVTFSFIGVAITAPNSTISGSTISGTHLVMANNLTPAGVSSATNTYLWTSSAMSGSLGASAYSAVAMTTNDTLTTSSSVSFFGLQLATGAGFTGNRNLLNLTLNITGAPAAGDVTGHVYQNVTAVCRASVNVGGTEDTFANSKGYYSCINPNMFLQSGATHFGVVTGGEIDNSIPAGASTVRNIGLTMVHTSTHANRGTLEDVGLLFADQGGAGNTWEHGVDFGGVSSQPSLGTDSTAIAYSRIIYPTLNGGGATPPIFGTGIDFQDVAATSYYLRFQNFAVDNVGYTYTNGINTTGTVQAQTASVASLSIVARGGHTGGTYPTKPTISIQAPPSGGVTATATVATMGLEQIPTGGVVAGGTGYTVGDTLTIVGSTGTAGTLTVATAPAGVITAVTIASAGSMSALAASPFSVTGGTGTGATFNGYYKILTTTVSAGGSGYSASPPPIVYTAGYSDSEVVPALLTASMTPVAAPLNLNPNGSNTVIGTGSALATNATAGFAQIATMAGAPSGTVGALGKAAIVVDTTNKKLCYSTGAGTWECSAAFTP